MRVIVPIKQILDPSGISVRRDKERVFINREDYIVDTGSMAALEAALRARQHDDEVIAISMGDSRADDALREALAMGCDSAYLLQDEAFEGADVAVAARILAAGIDKLGGADLVVAGRESSDTGAGQIGPRLAELLGYAQVTDVYALSLDDGAVVATRRWSTGYESVRAALPAVITVAPQAFPPRYPHGARIISAYRDWNVPVLTAEELGLCEDDLRPVLALRREGFPAPLESGEILRGEPESVAGELILALRLQQLLP